MADEIKQTLPLHVLFTSKSLSLPGNTFCKSEIVQMNFDKNCLKMLLSVNNKEVFFLFVSPKKKVLSTNYVLLLETIDKQDSSGQLSKTEYLSLTEFPKRLAYEKVNSFN